MIMMLSLSLLEMMDVMEVNQISISSTRQSTEGSYVYLREILVSASELLLKIFG